MKKFAIAATILLASTAAYAAQGMSCCSNCECCDDMKAGKHDGHADHDKAPAPAPSPAPKQ